MARLKSNEELLQDLKDDLQESAEAFSDHRRLAREDERMISGDQWPHDARMLREQFGRPTLTVNKYPQITRTIINDFKKDPLAINISPIGDNIVLATVLQSVVRYIEQQSDAQAVYTTALKNAVNSGIGYIRVTTDYVSPSSWEQMPFLRRILDPNMVYFDPNAQMADWSDARYCFVAVDYPRKQAEKEFPECNGMAWDANDPSWMREDVIRLVEYWYKEEKNHYVTVNENGENEVHDKKPEGVIDYRTVKMSVVKWALSDGQSILDKGDWAGAYLPIIPVLGDEVIVDGKRHYESIVRHSHDSQRAYNLWASTDAEMIMMAPKVPFIGAEGQFKNHEREWQNASKIPYAFLEYVPQTINGQAMPPPQRAPFDPQIQSLSAARANADADIKSTTGVVEASFGARGSEQSGKAIKARQEAGQLGNFHFTDSMTRSLKLLGKVLLDLFPKIIDTPRTIQLVGDRKNESKLQEINTTAETMIATMDPSKFLVNISAGPAYTSKRDEAVASIKELGATNPQMMQTIAHVLLRNLDWEGADEAADILEKQLPPHLKPGAPDVPVIPPEVQQQLASLQQQLAIAQQKASDSTLQLELQRMAIESKERIELEKLKSGLAEEIANKKVGEATPNQINYLLETINEISVRLSQLETKPQVSPPQATMQPSMQEPVPAGAVRTVTPGVGGVQEQAPVPPPAQPGVTPSEQ